MFKFKLLHCRGEAVHVRVLPETLQRQEQPEQPPEAQAPSRSRVWKGKPRKKEQAAWRQKLDQELHPSGSEEQTRLRRSAEFITNAAPVQRN